MQMQHVYLEQQNTASTSEAVCSLCHETILKGDLVTRRFVVDNDESVEECICAVCVEMSSRVASLDTDDHGLVQVGDRLNAFIGSLFEAPKGDALFLLLSTSKLQKAWP